MLKLGGQLAVTDADGVFAFPSVRPGTHALSVDGGERAHGKVPSQPMPIAVAVRAAQDALVDVALVEGVTLAGTVVTETLEEQRLAQGPDPGGQRRTRALANVLVVLRNGDTGYRRLTDAQGRFRLAGLVPGRWTASLEDESLPAGFEPAEREATQDVAPGARAQFDFTLKRRARTLRMGKDLPPVSQR